MAVTYNYEIGLLVYLLSDKVDKKHYIPTFL